MKTLQQIILEGKMSYQPQEGDSFSDMKCELISKLFQDLIKQTNKYLDKEDKDKCWDMVGLIQFFVHKFGSECGVVEKYSTQLQRVYNKCILLCDDDEWFDKWKDSEEIKKEVNKNRNKLHKLLDIIS